MKMFILRLLLPEWLLEMAEQIASQPSKCTTHPYWQVRYREWVCVGEEFSDEFIIVDEDSVIYESYRSDPNGRAELANHLWGYHENWCREVVDDEYVFFLGEDYRECFLDNYDPGNEFIDLPTGVHRSWVREEERIASTHLTESDAKWFIQRKQHDYPKLYTYVESAYWSPQIKQLQDFLKWIAMGKPQSEK